MIGFCARGTLRLPCPLARFGRSIGSARNHPEGHSLQFSGKMGNLAIQMSAFSGQIMIYQWIWRYPIFKPQYGCQQIWLIHNHQSGKHWNTTLSIDIHTLGWPSCSLLNKKCLSLSLSLFLHIYIHTHMYMDSKIKSPIILKTYEGPPWKSPRMRMFDALPQLRGVCVLRIQRHCCCSSIPKHPSTNPKFVWLVVYLSPSDSEKYEFVSWDYDIPNWMEVIFHSCSKPPTSCGLVLGIPLLF